MHQTGKREGYNYKRIRRRTMDEYGRINKSDLLQAIILFVILLGCCVSWG